MADYTNSRNYPPNHLERGSGAGFFWLLLVVALLGLVVLIGGIGGGPTAVDHPGGAGADPVLVAPGGAETLPDTGTTIVE